MLVWSESAICVDPVRPETPAYCPTPTPQVITEHPVTYSSVPLASYFTHRSVSMSVLLSQFIPPSPSISVSRSQFFMSASLFLPCKWVCQYHFSSFHIDDICFSLSDLFHSVWQTLGSSMSLQMTQLMLHLKSLSSCLYISLSWPKWLKVERLWTVTTEPSFRIPAFGELLPPRELLKICIWPSAEKTTLATPNAYDVRDSWSPWIPSMGPQGSWIRPQGPLFQ